MLGDGNIIYNDELLRLPKLTNGIRDIVNEFTDYFFPLK